MKICNCKCGNCENDDHGHCEYNCDEIQRQESIEHQLQDGYVFNSGYNDEDRGYKV